MENVLDEKINSINENQDVYQKISLHGVKQYLKY